MREWKWLAIVPLLAAVMVFGPVLFSGGNSNAPAANDGTWRRNAETAATPSFLTLGTSLGVVLLLAVGGIFLLRRLQAGQEHAREREIRVKESRRLSPKRSLHLIRAADRLLLLGESEVGLQLLADLTPREPEVTLPASAPVAVEPEPLEEDGAVPRDLVIPNHPRKETLKSQIQDFRELLGKLGAGK